MKSVFVLVKDDCDEYEGCITDVIGVFKMNIVAKSHRRKIVQKEIELQGDNFEKKEKFDNFVRVHTKNGTVTYLIDKKDLQ